MYSELLGIYMTRLTKELPLLVAVILLTFLSAVIVIDNAGAEPFITFKHIDVVVQIGVPCVLLVLWLQYAIWLIAGIVRKNFSIWWSPVLIWVAAASWFLSQCPLAYAQDITNFVIERK